MFDQFCKRKQFCHWNSFEIPESGPANSGRIARRFFVGVVSKYVSCSLRDAVLDFLDDFE